MRKTHPQVASLWLEGHWPAKKKGEQVRMAYSPLGRYWHITVALGLSYGAKYPDKSITNSVVADENSLNAPSAFPKPTMKCRLITSLVL